LADRLDEYDQFQELAGYVLEQPSALPPTDKVIAWGCMMFMTGPVSGPVKRMAEPIPRRFNGTSPKTLQLRPIGRLVPMAASQAELEAPPTVHSLRPVQSGQVYRITSTPARGLVRPELAEALETVFEQFAQKNRFTPEQPLEISLVRGFKANSHGHGEGRAADIADVGGKSLVAWKQEWDQAMASVENLSES
jgi:hypothetical protein